MHTLYVLPGKKYFPWLPRIFSSVPTYFLGLTTFQIVFQVSCRMQTESKLPGPWQTILTFD